MFIALTETHLRGEVKNAEIHISNYTPFRTDREGRSHGGVILYVRNDLSLMTKQILSLSNGQVELVAVHVASRDLLLINCYRPPNCSLQNFKGAMDCMVQIIEDLPQPMPDIVLCGDFNLPNIRWPEGTVSGGTLEEQTQARILLEITGKAFLTQQLMKPTRINNILDLYFTNNQDSITDYQVEKTIFSDHNLITINTAYRRSGRGEPENIPLESCPFAAYNFLSEKIKWEEVQRSASEVNWNHVMEGEEPNTMLQALTSKLLEICSKHIPMKRKVTKRFSHIPRDRKILMRRRASLNKQLRGTHTEVKKRSLLTKVLEIEEKLKESHKNQRSIDENRALNNIKRNPKYFFSYCKKFSKTKTQIGPLKNSEGNISTDPKITCQLLLQQYSSVFSDPQPHKIIQDPVEFFNENIPQAKLTDITITPKDIETAIKELRMNSSAGPDGVPAILLQKCSQSLAEPLGKLWRCSLDTGVIPQILKTANVCPIYKGGDRSLPKNYRPVALTSHLTKVFEKCARNKIVEHMETHHLFSDKQHGFRKGRSCLSKLLAHHDWVLNNLAEGKNVDVVFLDFAKAFDKVDHGILLHKVKTLGITGKLGVWIHAFLTKRLQAVTVDGHRSEKMPVTSGVPQGSVLGPLLFLIHMGGIGDEVEGSFLSSFADDTSVSLPITTAEDVPHLQQDLDAIYAWTTTNNMQFNENKFEMLRHGQKQELKDIKIYTEARHEISAERNVKCLGVYLSEDCSFHHHIAEIVRRAKGMAGWVLRTFATREPLPMLTLWKALIQPLTDYCSQLWSPHTRSEIQQLEGVQRSFTRQIAGMRGLGYWDRLRELLGLYSQQRRWDRYCYRAIYMWKILEGQVVIIWKMHHSISPYLFNLLEIWPRKRVHSDSNSSAPEFHKKNVNGYLIKK